jgi:carboxypeptidase Taq
VNDLPAAWNDRYKEFLGVDVPSDREGCLQDVHWSFGLVGYFPTYTLGNLYSAQFWDTIRSDVPGVEAGFANGNFGPLLEWTRSNIHRHGRLYRAGELCERATGAPLSPEPLIRHLERKFRPIYGI